MLDLLFLVCERPSAPVIGLPTYRSICAHSQLSIFPKIFARDENGAFISTQFLEGLEELFAQSPDVIKNFVDIMRVRLRCGGAHRGDQGWQTSLLKPFSLSPKQTGHLLPLRAPRNRQRPIAASAKHSPGLPRARSSDARQRRHSSSLCCWRLWRSICLPDCIHGLRRGPARARRRRISRERPRLHPARIRSRRRQPGRPARFARRSCLRSGRARLQERRALRCGQRREPALRPRPAGRRHGPVSSGRAGGRRRETRPPWAEKRSPVAL